MPTKRHEITELLIRREHGAKEISQIVGIREKEVYTHLSHIAKSVKAQKKKLRIVPSKCMACHYEFETRRRFTRPGHCPKCKSERILDPGYEIV